MVKVTMEQLLMAKTSTIKEIDKRLRTIAKMRKEIQEKREELDVLDGMMYEKSKQGVEPW